MGCSWFNTETNKKKTSINNKNMHQIVDKKSPVVAQQLYHMYATTRYNFVHLKATHKISPLEELVGGRSPPQQFPEVNRYAPGQIFRRGDTPRFALPLLLIKISSNFNCNYMTMSYFNIFIFSCKMVVMAQFSVLIIYKIL